MGRGSWLVGFLSPDLGIFRDLPKSVTISDYQFEKDKTIAQSDRREDPLPYVLSDCQCQLCPSPPPTSAWATTPAKTAGRTRAAAGATTARSRGSGCATWVAPPGRSRSAPSPTPTLTTSTTRGRAPRARARAGAGISPRVQVCSGLMFLVEGCEILLTSH